MAESADQAGMRVAGRVMVAGVRVIAVLVLVLVLVLVWVGVRLRLDGRVGVLGPAVLTVRRPVLGPVGLARRRTVRAGVVLVVAMAGAVLVAVAVLVMVPVVHGRPLPVRGSGRAGAHDAIMCV
ncbi:hypothetical protein [Streptomyces sp. NPDC048200]|uniref:hypothetical protein n=1 Tax=Streptomyces sp. NPDC048200 TaxID=3365512 RepID=UPI00371C648B